MSPLNYCSIDRTRNAYGCLRCNRSFVDEDGLLSHCSEAGVHRRSYCQQCKFLGYTPEDLSKHIGAEHEHNEDFCERCSLSFTSYDAYEDHLETCDGHWFCFKCDREEDTESLLDEHLVKQHCYCSDCDVNFANYRQHLEEQHDDSSEESSEVSVSAADGNTILNLHQDEYLRRSDEKSKECFGCYRKFSTYYGMLTHLESGACAGGIDQDDVDGLTNGYCDKACITGDESDGWLYACHQCDYNLRFSKASGWIQHMLSHEELGTSAKDASDFLEYLMEEIPNL